MSCFHSIFYSYFNLLSAVHIVLYWPCRQSDTVDKKKYVRLYALYSFLLHHVLQKVLQVDTDTLLSWAQHLYLP